MTVLSEECDEGGGGLELGVVGEVGEVTSLSGLAMRRPPKDCDSDRSPPLMVVGGEAAPAVMCASQWWSASASPVGVREPDGE